MGLPPRLRGEPHARLFGDPEQEYFVDGMVEDIITGLSRIKWLIVIARNSSFTYKGKAVDVRQVGRELGVRYVLDGGVRKAGSRLRITAQLIEAGTGAHLWADRFDGALENVFDLQDRITDSVVGIIEPSSTHCDAARLDSGLPSAKRSHACRVGSHRRLGDHLRQVAYRSARVRSRSRPGGRAKDGGIPTADAGEILPHRVSGVL